MREYNCIPVTPLQTWLWLQTYTPQNKFIGDLLSSKHSRCRKKIFLLVFTGLNALLSSGQVLFVLPQIDGFDYRLSCAHAGGFVRVCVRQGILPFLSLLHSAGTGVHSNHCPLLWWNGQGSFHSAAPWAGLVCLQHSWTAREKISLNWKGFWQDCGRDTVIHVLPPSVM